MAIEKGKAGLAEKIHQFIKGSFKPHFGQLTSSKSDSSLQRLSNTGSRLWLDTGSIEDIEKRWKREFSALTTNNTLLNKEIQTGRYDSLIGQAAELLGSYPELSEREVILEIAFILNAWHGLRLVEQFDAYVSVEEHTDLASNFSSAVEYGKRFYAICPERFIIKIPFTAAGLLATRKLSAEGIPVNHTLGFSARQNYVISRVSKPSYVNVFLGRLNSFVVDNKLGDGSFIGEKATLASQKIIKQLRKSGASGSLQIGASFRNGGQVRDLAGIDVMTIPPKVSDEFIALNLRAEEITDKTNAGYKIGLNSDGDGEKININTLWDVDERLVKCIDALEKEDIEGFSADKLVKFFESKKCGDVLVRWNSKQIATSMEEGKIPKLENWQKELANKTIGLDSLMNLAGLNSFTKDQEAMDERIRKVLAKKI